MTIHFPTRPALAPILFPTGENALHRLIEERCDARHLHDDNVHRVPAHIIARQLAWADRLNARIAQVAK